jgi:hypothetical protein
MRLVDRPGLTYVLLGLLAAAMLLPLLLVPMNSDNDTYQSMAFAMDQGKGLPYIGSWDQNFPGIVFYHWLSIKLFGLSDVGFRIVDLLNQVAIALITFAIARKYISVQSAWIVVPLSVIFYQGYGFWMLGQRDAFATTWLMLALLLVLSERRSTRQVLLAGVCIALATFIRPTLIVFAAIIFANSVGYRSLLRETGALSTGLIGTLLICLLPWIFTTGGMHEFITATIHFNKDVYGPNSREALIDFFHVFSVFTPFYVVAFISLCATLYMSRHRSIGVLVLIWFCCGAIGILAMGKFHVYHYAIYLPMLAILLAVGLSMLFPKPKVVLMVVFISIVAAYYLPRQAVSQFVKSGMTDSAREHIANNLASYPDLGREQETDVIRYLGSKKLGLSDVEFFLLWPGLRWRSGYVSDSRFTTTFALSMEGQQGLTSYQRTWQKEVAEMLMETRPKYVVSSIGPKHVFMFSRISSDSLIHHAENIRDVMRENYQFDTAIAGFRIYRLNDAPN